MKRNFMFTSESVTEGHPDKLCDQISDAVVDHFLMQDPFARVIAECAVSTSIVFIAARFTADALIDFPNIARQIITQVGYDHGEFNGKTCSILTSLRELPATEYSTVDERMLSDAAIEKIAVKNQVTVFGYACNQTAAFMPMPIWLANKLARRLTAARLQKALSYLAPDGKTQVGIEFRDRKPVRIHSIAVIASQHKKSGVELNRLRDDIYETVIEPVFADEEVKPDEKTRIFVNPDGPFITGGPSVHSGLTGRKNAIDTYGEYSRHSGAALSGKDPVRIDRVGAYAARYAAKNVVASGLASECEVQLSYSIGLARPVSVQVQTFGTGRIDDDDIAARVERLFDFRVAGIVKQFNLRHLPGSIKGGFYRKLAAYGHIGRMDIWLPWELTDKSAFIAEK
ncbi:MAG TPA: methionine adenosyltransferase [Dissulfurispiraceae bacterium]|nr:methionine adenosyltransferase [Dissulfurispiraceae bacterium]